MREGARLLRRAVALRAEDLRPRARRGRPRDRSLCPRLLSPRPGFVRRADGDEAVTRDPQEPEAPEAARALPGRQDQALQQAGPGTARPALPPRPRLVMDPGIGDVYLSGEELAVRVRELGAEIARDYADREPILVGSLKASLVFIADLSRAI